MMKDLKNTCSMQHEGLKYRVQFEIESQEVDQLINKKYHNFKSKAKIKGCREGKVPLSFIV